MLQQNPELAERYQRQFFQFRPRGRNTGTNRIQAGLHRHPREYHGNVMVLGDDAQSIYSWRGANFKTSSISQALPECATYKIETNYAACRTSSKWRMRHRGQREQFARNS